MSDPTPPGIPPVPPENHYTAPPAAPAFPSMPPAPEAAQSIPGVDTSIPAEIRQMAMFTHLIAIVSSFIGPLIIWQTQKHKSPFLDYHGKEALNFQITVALAYLVSMVLVVVLIGILLMPAVLITGLVFTIIAGLKANDGIYYRYPFIIRFIK